MRMSTDEARDEQLAIATIIAAIEAGITVFDTARAYAPDASQLGHNERLLARALGSRDGPARVVTKGGMTRPGGAWIPDGRARAILADCEASLEALGGIAIDLYLLHAPDPRTPWRTSVRALAKLIDDGVVSRVGLSNVNRRQLEEACELAPVAAVQVALSCYDDRAVRGGALELCAERGIAVIAHSPLGGPGRARGVARLPALADVARRRDATAAEVALAWLLERSDAIVAIPGARRPETARSAARAAALELGAGERAALDRGFGAAWRQAPAAPPKPTAEAEVVLIIGIPGAGKSRIAIEYTGRGYLRLNRDQRGGSLRGLADALDEQLGSGAERIVLDNTYVTRVARSYVLDAAGRHGVPVRCIWLDTPLDQAQVNLVQRILDRFGSLPAPPELRAVSRREPGLMLPTSQMRVLRELEAPTVEEGFASVDRVPFVRASAARQGGAGVLVAARALEQPGWERALGQANPSVPHLVFDWRPDGSPEDLAPSVERVSRVVDGPVEIGLCPHGGGPPACWCRPPLPGLALAFARSHGVETSHTTVIGSSAAHRTLARALGASYVASG